jgi:peptidoglycan/LPS O-acetylase OafA/YrhL
MFSGGSHGVDLFFVLSGFLITRILLRERTATGTINFGVFYLKRVLRIFPIYYLCAAVFAFAFPADKAALPSLLTYTFNYYHPFHPAPVALEHTWSLAVEEQFYVVWPWVVALMPIAWGRTVTRFVIPGLALLAALAFAATLESELAGNLIYVSGPTRMMSLSLGASLAYAELDARVPPTWRIYAEIAAGALVLAADYVGRARGIVPAGGYYWCVALIGYVLLSLGTLSLLLYARDPLVARLRSFLTLGPVRYIGRISYGLYLYHYFILFLIGIPAYKTATTGTTPALLLFALALSLAVAAASFRYLESPLLSLKARLGDRVGAPAVAS